MTKAETLKQIDARIRFFHARLKACTDPLDVAQAQGAVAALQWALLVLTRGDAIG